MPLAVRVGLSAGDVSMEDDDVHGTPVIEAARLCGAAGGGEILASEMVRWLARGSTANFVPVGELELKGLPEAVPAVRVEWEPVATSAIPMPNLLTDVGRIFVGREAELERLGQLWKEAGAGERRVVLLAGEPGVGKTRLAAELASSVHDHGAIVLAGRCDEDLGIPYQPFVEALRHFLDHAPRGELRDHLGRYGGELARLVPEMTESVPDLPAPLRSDPETERYRLFDAVAAWLAAAATAMPVLLILDDLQWAAKPTLLLLRHVVRSPDLQRILVLGTYRDTELHHDHPLVEVLADLRRQAGVERLSLVGFDSAGVAAFMEQAAGHDLDEDDEALARAIHEETEGNPFFVREVLRHLADTGALERRQGRWTTRLSIEELGIPESVREVVGRRLSRLSPQANTVLRVAAVIGAEFDLALFQAALTLDDEALVSALEEATAARLITEVAGATGHYRFAHALVRDTLYDGLSAARRVNLHRLVAETIERVHAGRLDDQLPALAQHFARASAPAAETGKAAAYAQRAGDRALTQLAHDEAAKYYRQALELLEVADGPVAPAQRLELLISLGEAQRRAGDLGHRETLLQAAHMAQQRGDAAALARAALANSRGLVVSNVGSVDTERVAALEAALTADVDSGAIRARLLASLGVELMYSPDHQRRAAVTEEALALARQVGDLPTLAHVMSGRFNAICTPHTLAERLPLTAELLTLAERLGDPALSSRAWFVRYRAALEAGDVEEADRALEAFVALATALGQPGMRWAVTWNRAGRLLLAGSVAEADAELHTAVELGQASGQPDALQFFYFGLFLVRFEQGRLDELEQEWLEVVARFPGMSSHGPALALLYCELDRDHDARAAIQRLAVSGFDVPLDVLWGHSITYCALVCAHLEDTDGAALLRERLAPYDDQIVIPAGGFTNGAIAHYVGVLDATLGDYDVAGAHFRKAAEIHARIGAPTWLARTRLEWARMLLTRRQPGDADRARELLGQALTTARELGLANVVRRAVALLQECP